MVRGRIPRGLKSTRLNNFCGADLDPAAVLQVPVTIAVNSEVEVVFLLGQAPQVENVREIVAKFHNPGAVTNGLAHARGWWDGKLGTVQVQTPTSPWIFCSTDGCSTRR